MGGQTRLRGLDQFVEDKQLSPAHLPDPLRIICPPPRVPDPLKRRAGSKQEPASVDGHAFSIETGVSRIKLSRSPPRRRDTRSVRPGRLGCPRPHSGQEASRCHVPVSGTWSSVLNEAVIICRLQAPSGATKPIPPRWRPTRPPRKWPTARSAVKARAIIINPMRWAMQPPMQGDPVRCNCSFQKTAALSSKLDNRARIYVRGLDKEPCYVLVPAGTVVSRSLPVRSTPAPRR